MCADDGSREDSDAEAAEGADADEAEANDMSDSAEQPAEVQAEVAIAAKEDAGAMPVKISLKRPGTAPPVTVPTDAMGMSWGLCPTCQEQCYHRSALYRRIYSTCLRIYCEHVSNMMRILPQARCRYKWDHGDLRCLAA